MHGVAIPAESDMILEEFTQAGSCPCLRVVVPLPMPNSVASSSGRRLTRNERLTAGLVILLIPALFGTAFCLIPHPAGFGTHRQLGLPGCVVQSLTGCVCPHCGLTTSFAWFVRGAWLASWNANPAGWILACCLLLLWPWLILVRVRGFLTGIQRPEYWFVRAAAVWLLICLLQWLVRML